MTALLLGGTGLLGQAVVREARRRGVAIRTAARRDGDIELDLSGDDALAGVLAREKPSLTINCAALVDVAACEADPGRAYLVNAAPLRLLSQWSNDTGNRLVHVSTDHFFPNGGATPHREDEPVTLVNHYAATKYAGERFALLAAKALVLRTSIVGLRGWSQPTFAEWALKAILNDEPATLFSDAFTSSIDVDAFARAMFDLSESPAAGIYNVAAAEVYSKEAFVRTLANELGRSPSRMTSGTVGVLNPPRPASLGLDTGRAGRLLAWRLPGLHSVVKAVADQHRDRLADEL